MKVVVTGASGALGTVLSEYLAGQDVEVVGWDRPEVPVNNYPAMEDFLRTTGARVVFHLAVASQPTGKPNESWQINYSWASELAWLTRTLNIRFVFTSSIMVFTPEKPGPYTVASAPNASEGYGFEKRRAEEQVLRQNPQAIVARLGWQIGSSSGSNNMIDFFERQMREQGHIAASRVWYPATSFLEDTAAALFRLTSAAGGLYQLDSNRRWSFFEIATALNDLHGNLWIIRGNHDFTYDQRMLDDRVGMPPLNERLLTLP